MITDAHRASARLRPAADIEPATAPDPGERKAGYIDLHRAIGRLKGRQRRVVELKYLAGLDNAEVAAALRTTPGAVNALQWRALRNLEQMLEVPEEGVAVVEEDEET